LYFSFLSIDFMRSENHLFPPPIVGTFSSVSRLAISR